MKLNRDLSMNGLLGLVEWLVGCERPFMLAVTNGLLGLVEWLVGCERPFMLAVQLVQGDVSVCVCMCQLPTIENYIRPQIEFYITVIRLFGVKMATIIVILLSIRSKIERVRHQ